MYDCFKNPEPESCKLLGLRQLFHYFLVEFSHPTKGPSKFIEGSKKLLSVNEVPNPGEIRGLSDLTNPLVNLFVQ